MKLDQATGAVVGSVLLSWAHTTPEPVSVDASNIGMDELPGGRFAAKVVVLDGMRAVGLLAIQKGVRWERGFGKGFGGLRARYWPTPAMLDLAAAAGVTADTVKTDFRLPPPAAVPRVSHPGTASMIKNRWKKRARWLPLTALGPDAGVVVDDLMQWNAFAAATSVAGCRSPALDETIRA